MDYQKLVDEAFIASENAYAPYSSFKVGASLLLTDGTIIHGTNIENAAYGSTTVSYTHLVGTVDGNTVTVDLLDMMATGKSNDIIVSSELSGGGMDMSMIFIIVGVAAIAGVVAFMLMKMCIRDRLMYS